MSLALSIPLIPLLQIGQFALCAGLGSLAYRVRYLWASFLFQNFSHLGLKVLILSLQSNALA